VVGTSEVVHLVTWTLDDQLVIWSARADGPERREIDLPRPTGYRDILQRFTHEGQARVAALQGGTVTVRSVAADGAHRIDWCRRRTPSTNSGGG
jgi:hypothetical protein